MTLFERVFGGNDAVYGLTEGAIDAAIAQHGEEKAVSFPNTAYALPCYYAVTGTKVTNLKDYSGNDIKNGSNITIHGSMTLLYPFNVQGFYEIKEGDQVEFFISDVSTEDGIIVETSYLNLVTAP